MVKFNFKSGAYSIFIIIVNIFFILQCLVLSCSETNPIDPIPPGNVRDLDVISSNFYGIQISFTAPGDDSFYGKALRFEIRYSTSELFFLSPSRYFDTIGSLVPDSPEPPVGGSIVEFLIKDLDPNKRYFVALRTYDDAGNVSEVSNVAQGKTKDVPGTSGIFLGSLELPSVFSSIASDGKNIYLIFPGLYILEKKGDGYEISPVNKDIPPIEDAEVIFDGEKFIALGGHISGSMVEGAVAIYPQGSVVIMRHEGDIVPFGANGFFGYGIIGHRIVKLGDMYLVIGGVRYTDRDLERAKQEGKSTVIGIERIPYFHVHGNTLVWGMINVEGLTRPTDIFAHTAFPLGENLVLIWGGLQSEIITHPLADMFTLRLKNTNTKEGKMSASWEFFFPFSGRNYSVYGACSASRHVRVFKLRYVRGITSETDIHSVEDVKIGDVYLFEGKPVKVVDDKIVDRIIVVGNFRKGNESFSGIIGYFFADGKYIFSRMQPTSETSETGYFLFPKFGRKCSAEYLDKKLFLLYLGKIYIFNFKDVDFEPE